MRADSIIVVVVARGCGGGGLADVKAEDVDGDGFVLGSAPAHDGVYDGFCVLLAYSTECGENVVELGVDTWTHKVG